jgi:hypothetical protein
MIQQYYVNFFKFNLYNYFSKKNNSKNRGGHFLSTYRTFKATFFFNNFFNYLYLFFSLGFENKKLMFIYSGSTKANTSIIKSLVLHTGNFYTSK